MDPNFLSFRRISSISSNSCTMISHQFVILWPCQVLLTNRNCVLKGSLLFVLIMFDKFIEAHKQLKYPIFPSFCCSQLNEIHSSCKGMHQYTFAFHISITHRNMIVQLTGKFCWSMAMLMQICISGQVDRFPPEPFPQSRFEVGMLRAMKLIVVEGCCSQPPL